MMLENTSTKTQPPSLITLWLLVSFGSVAAILYTPALPTIAQYFSVSTASAQNTMTIFLVGYAGGQLLYGPLTHRFGLKQALYIGIALTIFSALLCVVAAALHTFSLLMIARLLMALGACAGLKITFTIIGESYPPALAAKAFSYVNIAFAIMPGIGVSIGGFLTQYINWQSCFYFLVIYSLFLLLLATKLPDIHIEKDHHALHFKNIKSSYWKQIHDSNLLLNALYMGCFTAIIYVFITVAPFIVIENLQLSADKYGLLNFLPPIGLLLGSLTSARYAHKAQHIQAMYLAIIAAFTGMSIMLVSFAIGSLNIFTLFLPTMIMYFGLPVGYSHASAIATSQSTDKSYATALMHFINIGFAVVCVFISGFLPLQYAVTLPIFFAVLIGVMIFTYQRIKTYKLKDL